jgi:cytosine/adenosine deaminase-related metal-dependent hydrolase
MIYRKFAADYLFTGTSILDDNFVLVSDGAGKILDIVEKSDGSDDVEKLSGILTPGFVNAHCHIELSHLKNAIPEHTGLVNFVYKIVTERNFKDDEILESIIMAEDEMLKCGIVAVGDICNNNLSLSQKKKRRLDYHNFIEIAGWNPSVASQMLTTSLSYYAKFIENNLRASLVPHAPYSVSSNLWGNIFPYFDGAVISIHNQETIDEDEFFLSGNGNVAEMYKKLNIDNSFYDPPHIRSVETYFKKFSEAASVILVHNTFMKQEDLEYINKNKVAGQLVSFCICANANRYIENALPPVDMFIRNNCHVVIGTDSLASNHQLNFVEELKTISKNFPEILLETMLEWATINGAKALKMDDKWGSFEKGKKPGIVLIENVAGKKLNKNTSARRIL